MVSSIAASRRIEDMSKTGRASGRLEIGSVITKSPASNASGKSESESESSSSKRQYCEADSNLCCIKKNDINMLYHESCTN